MRERPILFNGAMVRAILDGRKTVTRRVVKPAPVGELRWNTGTMGGHVETWADDLRMFECPFGLPRDRLWVRETFALLGNEDGVCIDWQDNMVRGDERGAARIYRASCEVGDHGLWQIPDKADWKPDTDGMQYEGTWRPSIHMPRWACRILLEITDVRVERLQDITYEQAAAEGIHRHNRMWSATDDGGFCHKYPEPAFRDLWQLTGGDWDANPWVWVVEFKRVEVANVR